MPCPTCDHTMTELGCRTTGSPFFVCPRCGTAKLCDGVVVVPALVDACRLFPPDLWSRSSVGGTVTLADILAAWEKLGIRDSINLPGQRAL